MRLAEIWQKTRASLDPRAETFSTVLTFLLGSAIRLLSSLVLTRLLYPEAYGIIAILMSVLFMIEMLSDIGVVGLVIRHERGDDPHFLNSLWTVRVVRCAINSTILLVSAPWLANFLGNPVLVQPLQVITVYFLANAIESMAFPVALRHRRVTLVNYIGLACSVTSTAFCIVYSYYARDHWGLVFAAIFERTISAIASHFIYPALRPRFVWDREAIREIFVFARYVLPTSMITMALSQFERFIFVRLFDLRLMGIYGVAGSVAGPVEALCNKISHVVLYPRYSNAARNEASRLRDVFYRDNRKHLLLMFILPALAGGAGQHIIWLLYDDRYREAGVILQWFMMRTLLMSYLRPAEQVLTAIGQIKVQFYANILRAILIVPLTLLGYKLAGLQGFVIGLALEPLAAVVYIFFQQHKHQLLDIRRDASHAVLAAGIWVSAGFAAEGMYWLYKVLR